MTKRILFLSIMAGAIISIDAETLFYTDFQATPAGFAAASAVATANGKEDTLIINPSGASAPKDTIIDGCTLSANKSSTSTTMIVISKKTQTCVSKGDTAGCTPGRLSLKNSGDFIELPKVKGPCTMTYYAAGTSNSAGKGIQCLVNGISTPEAGIDELRLDTFQATRKMVYPFTGTDSVAFRLIAIGSVYLYDIKIESGAVTGAINSRSIKAGKSIRTKGNTAYNAQKACIVFYTLAGKMIMRSAGSTINVSALPKGVYVACVATTGEKITIAR